MEGPKYQMKMRDHTPLREVAHTLFSAYRQRSLVGSGADDRAGVLLQLRSSYLCAGAERLYDIASKPGSAGTSSRVAAGNFLGPWCWPAVRHVGPPGHDYAHLWRIRGSARAVRLPVRDRPLSAQTRTIA